MRISVAVPVFNGAEHLSEAIESVQKQTMQPDEIRVFDNASTDATVKIALEHLPAPDVVLAPRNEGAVENFNRAVRETTGDLFMWLAADDALRPEYLETCVRELEAHPDAPACLTGIQFVDSTGEPTRTSSDIDLASPDPGTRLRSFLRRRRWTEVYCLYRRDWLERSPLFSDAHGSDVALTWWFLLRTPLAVTPEPLLVYREYPLTSVDQATEKAATAISPDRVRTHWNKARLWRRLRAMTRDPDIEPAVARQARRELWLLATWPGIAFWVIEDVLERWPMIDRVLRRVWVRLGAPGQIAPTS